jgi:hypothetical protein
MLQNDSGPIFRLGKVTLTPGAKQFFSGVDIVEAILRHMRGPCLDHPGGEGQTYFPFLLEGLSLGGFYVVSSGREVFIYTEADRSRTLVMLPDEI